MWNLINSKILGYIGIFLMGALLLLFICQNIQLKEDRRRLQNNIIETHKEVQDLIFSKGELKRLFDQSEELHIHQLDSLRKLHNITLNQLDGMRYMVSQYVNKEPIVIHTSDTIRSIDFQMSVDTLLVYQEVPEIDFFDGCWGIKGSIVNNTLEIVERRCDQEGIIIDYSRRKRIWWAFGLRVGSKEHNYVMETACGEIKIKEYRKK